MGFWSNFYLVYIIFFSLPPRLSHYQFQNSRHTHITTYHDVSLHLKLCRGQCQSRRMAIDTVAFSFHSYEKFVWKSTLILSNSHI